ncbi:hypothetical protein [endosymbiont GvMRE of Glomus versiforme]|uniref:hypothetical protein n=1 Tax=endosymbiont GvMRE of Glomus versiforme TaxID=2039283 RepID=UPI0011C45507|nr:hypothetical protein [endosymbiont GvMRE of Glomus versiforme]
MNWRIICDIILEEGDFEKNSRIKICEDCGKELTLNDHYIGLRSEMTEKWVCENCSDNYLSA